MSDEENNKETPKVAYVKFVLVEGHWINPANVCFIRTHDRGCQVVFNSDNQIFGSPAAKMASLLDSVNHTDRSLIMTAVADPIAREPTIENLPPGFAGRKRPPKPESDDE